MQGTQPTEFNQLYFYSKSQPNMCMCALIYVLKRLQKAVLNKTKHRSFLSVRSVINVSSCLNEANQNINILLAFVWMFHFPQMKTSTVQPCWNPALNWKMLTCQYAIKKKRKIPMWANDEQQFLWNILYKPWFQLSSHSSDIDSFILMTSPQHVHMSH